LFKDGATNDQDDYDSEKMFATDNTIPQIYGITGSHNNTIHAFSKLLHHSMYRSVSKQEQPEIILLQFLIFPTWMQQFQL